MPPVPAAEQVRRLLVMIPWLTARGRVPLDELAAAFGISAAQAEADVNQASMLGVPPYTGGCYVNVFLDDDGAVYADPGPYLTRPPRLSAAQGFALLASAQALLDDLGTTAGAPLVSAVRKLERMLGDPNVVDVDLQRPAQLAAVRDAVDTGTQLRIRYYTAWRDDENERDIDPHVVFQRNGRWYVRAYCHRVEDVRSFRVDRIRSLTPTGARFEPVRAEPPSDVYVPGDDATRVVIDIPATERWVVEAYHPAVEERGDTLRVTLRVIGTAWLERLLLKLGPAGRVVEPPELRSLGADAARRLLDAYD